MTLQPDEMLLEEKKRQEELLAIPGVMFSDTQVREYPLGEAAAHLIGYVQDVTSDDLKEHSGEGYTNDSVIGRSGVESLFEEKKLFCCNESVYGRSIGVSQYAIL